jgi:hypothetical protein
MDAGWVHDQVKTATSALDALLEASETDDSTESMVCGTLYPNKYNK